LERAGKILNTARNRTGAVRAYSKVIRKVGNMKINDMLSQMRLKKTWSRVTELLRRGYYKDKEKRILFGAPIPPEDVLPLRISLVIGMAMIFLVLLISASFYLHLFPIFVNIVLITLLAIVLFLPNIVVRFFNETDGKKK
jgi:hypothetical protein